MKDFIFLTISAIILGTFLYVAMFNKYESKSYKESDICSCSTYKDTVLIDKLELEQDHTGKYFRMIITTKKDK